MPRAGRVLEDGARKSIGLDKYTPLAYTCNVRNRHGAY